MLFLVADDITRIRSRVEQLLGKSAWAENPALAHAPRRNVRVRAVEGESIYVTANFVVYRMRFEQMDTYLGRYEYTLVQRDGRLKIRERRAILDLNVLRPHGKLSIIRSNRTKVPKVSQAPRASHRRAKEVLPPRALRGLKLARVKKVLEGCWRDRDDPGNGRFGDVLASEQLDFLPLPSSFDFPKAP